MKQYAIKIRKSDLALITFLNGGVTPEVQKTPTYLIFSADGSSESSSKVVTERELYDHYEISSRSPLVLALKK